MTNILSDLRRLTEAVHAAGADIAPTYREYVQLAFAIATDCGEAGRSDFLMLCSLSAKYDVHAANKLFSNGLPPCRTVQRAPPPRREAAAGHSRGYTWYAGCTVSPRLTHACARLL